MQMLIGLLPFIHRTARRTCGFDAKEAHAAVSVFDVETIERLPSPAAGTARYVRVHECVRARMRACSCARVRVHMRVRVRVCARAFLFVCVRACLNACACARARVLYVGLCMLVCVLLHARFFLLPFFINGIIFFFSLSNFRKGRLQRHAHRNSRTQLSKGNACHSSYLCACTRRSIQTHA